MDSKDFKKIQKESNMLKHNNKMIIEVVNSQFQ